MNARKCRWCATNPCPYPSNKDFSKQVERGGHKWLEEKPCWTPIPENIGDLYTAEGQLLPEGYAYFEAPGSMMVPPPAGDPIFFEVI